MTPKIYDCFIFFNEFELLEIRIHHLWELVDFFVIVEGDHTFRGHPKPFFFEEHKDRFAWALSKIIHIKKYLDVSEKKFDRSLVYNPDDDNWKLEMAQRDAILDGLSNAEPDDIILISDVDEIPSHACIQFLPSVLATDHLMVLALLQVFLYYFLDYRADTSKLHSNGPVAIRYRYLRSPQDLRDDRNFFASIKEGGHHFSFLGGVERIRQKLASYSHSEYDTEFFKDQNYIEQAVRSGRYLFDSDPDGMRIFSHYDIETDPFYPQFIIQNRDRYPHLFVPKEWTCESTEQETSISDNNKNTTNIQEAVKIINQAFQEAQNGTLSEAVFLHLRNLLIDSGNQSLANELERLWNGA